MTLGHERGGLGGSIPKVLAFAASAFSTAVTGAGLSAAQTDVLILLGTH